jgi:membrane protease YdiL (CAAX protease family)
MIDDQSSQWTESVGSREDRKRNARAGLKMYFAFLVLFTGISDAFAIATGHQYPWLAFEMCSPAAASIITRLVRREGFRDVSWRLRSGSVRRAIVVGALYPAVISVIAYGIGWSTGLVGVTSPGTVLGIDLSGSGPLVVQVALAVVLVFVFDGLFNVLPVLGEEMGWRGYMLTRLVEAEVPRPVLTTGIIWALWHMPIIFGGVYLTNDGVGSAPLIALLFLLSILLQNQVICRLRLVSGSIWPAVAYHAVWNAVIQAALAPAATGSNAWFLVGEQGIILLVVNLAGVLLLSRLGKLPAPAVTP